MMRALLGSSMRAISSLNSKSFSLLSTVVDGALRQLTQEVFLAMYLCLFYMKCEWRSLCADLALEDFAL